VVVLYQINPIKYLLITHDKRIHKMGKMKREMSNKTKKKHKISLTISDN